MRIKKNNSGEIGSLIYGALTLIMLAGCVACLVLNALMGLGALGPKDSQMMAMALLSAAVSGFLMLAAIYFCLGYLGAKHSNG